MFCFCLWHDPECDFHSVLKPTKLCVNLKQLDTSCVGRPLGQWTWSQSLSLTPGSTAEPLFFTYGSFRVITPAEGRRQEETQRITSGSISSEVCVLWVRAAFSSFLSRQKNAYFFPSLSSRSSTSGLCSQTQDSSPSHLQQELHCWLLDEKKKTNIIEIFYNTTVLRNIN